MKNQNEHLWDGEGYEAGDAFDLKYEEWEQRDWMTWLATNLVFPFNVTREEDEDDAYFQKGAAKAPFRLGHTMEILGLGAEDDRQGIIVKAREKGRIDSVPLCDLEVKPKTDKNYWPVREYVVWFANR
ncbi:MAG: calcium-binding protein [Limisphaerales bacterium]